MAEEHDPMIDRIAGTLRSQPHVDEAAKARVLVAVAAERERDRELAARRTARRGAMRWIARGAAVAAAAAFVAVMLQPAAIPTVAIAPVTPTTSQSQPVVLAAHEAAADPSSAPQDVQLVFKAPAAAHVRVVGDFNGWDAQRAPMTRDVGTGLWSVTLSLKPGRHVYAFVVDDTLWMRDPRAPAAHDADFGRPGSVLLVGRP